MHHKKHKQARLEKENEEWNPIGHFHRFDLA